MKPALLIPVYNHGKAFQALSRKLSRMNLPVIVVDDGSEQETRDILEQLDRRYPSFETLQLDENRGKGRAVQAGIRYAQRAGYTHVLQIDADAQHDPSDIPLLLEKTKAHPESLILGIPTYDETIPTHRYYSRYLTHVWTWIETISLDIPDALCGYRVYPVEQTLELFRKYEIGDRMEFDPGIAVRFYWEGGDIQTIKTQVTYHEDVVSNFNPFLDTVRISWMHFRCVCGMLYRFPELLRRTIGTDSPQQAK